LTAPHLFIKFVYFYKDLLVELVVIYY
jgi:hypothetical protein